MAYAKTHRFAFLLPILALLLILVTACGQKPESIASKVAQEWTSSSMDTVSSSLSTAVFGNIPGIQQVAASIIGEQIRKNVTWSYSKPSRLSEGRYEVIATATATINIRVLIIQQSYGLSADFPLTIDTKNKKVIDWKLGDFQFAKR